MDTPDPQEFERLLKIFQSPRFLGQEGLGNEIPYFVYAFDPKDEYRYATMRQQLVKRLEDEGTYIADIDLFQLCMDILEERQILRRLMDRESTLGAEEVLEVLQGPLDPGRYIVPRIAETIEPNRTQLVFLTGVGAVYPFLRSHTILNSLQSVVNRVPVVLFFPGEYDHSPERGSTLKLFGRLRGDTYYRAFNLNEYTP
jgi:hypothetical protein